MDTISPAPLPSQVGQTLDLVVMIFEFLLLCGLIERAVAVCKHLRKFTWRTPWVMIAFIFCWASCMSYHIDLIYFIYKVAPGPVLIFLPGSVFGVLITALAATGGGAGIVEWLNVTVHRSEQIHTKKLQILTNGTTTVSTGVSTTTEEVKVTTP